MKGGNWWNLSIKRSENLQAEDTIDLFIDVDEKHSENYFRKSLFVN